MAVAAPRLPIKPDPRLVSEAELDADTIMGIALRISRILEQHPNISATRLGNHIRPYRRNWRLILEDMIDKEIVERVVVSKPIQTGATRTTYVFRLKTVK